MIQGFGNKDAEKLWNGDRVSRFQSFQRTALIKLQLLNTAAQLSDLKVPPGNRLEALKGNRKGQHSIRINGQYRICFTWTQTGPTSVEIVDYY